MEYTNIIDEVCFLTGVKKRDVLSKKQSREIADVRHIIAYCIKKISEKSTETNLSLCQIGYFINRSHSSVINSIKVCEGTLIMEKDFEIIIRSVINKYTPKNVIYVNLANDAIINLKIALSAFENKKDKEDLKKRVLKIIS